MNAEKLVDGVRVLLGWAITLALIPVRAPKPLLRFARDWLTRREQERAWRKHGVPMMPRAEEWLSPLWEEVRPDPRKHH
jgi:hypothetical protein